MGQFLPLALSRHRELMKIPNALNRAAIVALGVGLGPLVQLLAMPVLSRIYMPTEFGHLALFLSVVSIVVTVSCLRYEGAIQVVKDSEVEAIAWTALLSAGLLFLITVALLLTGLPQQRIESLLILGGDAKWVPAVALCGAMILIGSNITMREGRYVRNAAIRSSQSIIFVLFAIAASELGLLVTSVLASLVVGLGVFIYLIRVIRRIPFSDIRKTAKKYLEYPMLVAPTSLLDAAALTLPVLFISGSYGFESTGHYTQIQRLIGAPILMAGIVVGQLFMKRSGELFRSGHSSRTLLWKSVGILSVGAIALLIGLATFGEVVCRAILGDAWRVDTKFLLIVMTPLLFRAVVSPITTITLTHGRIRVGTLWQVYYFASTYLGLLYAARTMNFEKFLIFYAIIEIVAYSLYLILADKVASNFSGKHVK
ncbi:MAG TPA: oligosaccharide flippase family protein [Polaromonas sp.]|uniref:lipopolysaccharide biosynthesis protein n=1 Tax=Polaromonas sp. TaxID=1869339 RepID=UPI002D47E923|nr:oligosaccharide flippase family protein [Polaromonas sp.]HYW56837.1 oligosaccharide flippase family protein [Polaromonas sp.]